MGSQLLENCKDMENSFSNLKYRLRRKYGVQFQPDPVDAHYSHGKAEQKIQKARKSIEKELGKKRLSLIQWEIFNQLISNTKNISQLGLENNCGAL